MLDINEPAGTLPSGHPILWSYYPKLFQGMGASIFPLLQSRVATYPVADFTGNFNPSKHMSCVFLREGGALGESAKSSLFSYSKVPTFPMSELGEIAPIGEHLAQNFGLSWHHILCHIYRDGDDMVGFHSDKEALNDAVFSVSFGATRLFRFRPIKEKSGHVAEIALGDGDLLIMHKGCQRVYKHGIPVQKLVKEPRINLTFRV